jgi:hypothetical protein
VNADNEIVLQYLQENTFPPYEEMPVSSRVEVATTTRWHLWDNTPALMRKALRGGKDIAEAITWTNKDGETLLHVFVSALAWNSAIKVYPHSGPCTREPIYDNSVCDVNFETGDNFGMWRELVRGCISAGASIEAVDLARRTPLQALIDAFWNPFRDSNWSLEKVSGQLEYTLYCWLADLAAAGVDLEKYGATESSIRQRRTLADSTFRFRLVGFSYGSLVTDWQFWFSNPTDIFAGDFWAMIETLQDDDLGPQPTLDIPGSWSEGEE